MQSWRALLEASWQAGVTAQCYAFVVTSLANNAV
jgi:hypothetical protein